MLRVLLLAYYPVLPHLRGILMNRKNFLTSLVARAICLLVTFAFVSPSESLAQKIRFAVIGDYGSAADKGAEAEQQVADMVKSWNPSFIITVGDNNYGCGASNTIVQNIGNYYCDFIYNPGAPAGQVCTGRAANDKTNYFFPSLGNHDWYTPNAQPYLDYFTQLPGNKRYYDFVQGPVQFFALDSESIDGCQGDEEETPKKCSQTPYCPEEPDGSDKYSKQALWLKAALTKSKSPWKLVFFHRPPYSCGAAAAWMRWPFEKWGVNAVLAGHHHVYERIVRKSYPNFPYFVNGVGGIHLAKCHPHNVKKNFPPNKFEAVNITKYHGAMLVEASDTEIVFKFYIVDGQNGTVKDTCTLSKTKGGQNLSCSGG